MQIQTLSATKTNKKYKFKIAIIKAKQNINYLNKNM